MFREFRPAFARKLAQLREPIAGADNLRFPARRILDLIGDKWTPVVLYCIWLREVRRFNELQRQIPNISKKNAEHLLIHGALDQPVALQITQGLDQNRISAHRRRQAAPGTDLAIVRLGDGKRGLRNTPFARRDNLKGHTTYKGEAPARRTFIRCVIDFCTMPKGRFVWSEAEIRTDTQPTFYIFFNLGDGRDQASAA